jgi:hypothetical protein
MSQVGNIGIFFVVALGIALAACGGGGGADCALECGAHGTCVAAGGSPRCECAPGYLGSRCDTCARGYHAEKETCVPDQTRDGGADAGLPDSGASDAGGSDASTDVGSPADGGFEDSPDAGTAEDGGTGDAGTTDDGGFYDASVGDTGTGDAGLGDLGTSDTGVPGPCLPNPCVGQNRTVCREDGRGGHLCFCAIGFQDNDENGSCLPTCFGAGFVCGDGTICSDASGTAQCVAGTRPPIYISFHWHMHQPIYWPYESIVETERLNRTGYSVYEIHNARTGPYTSWPRDAVDSGRSLPHLGAQVSFSGSLMENLGAMESAGAGFAGWNAPWREAMGWLTSRGNPRLDLVSFGYHHPLMGLVDTADIRMQVQAHREMAGRMFGPRAAKGIFPPECAFSSRMIPALSAEGIEWALVDNIHFDRARPDYPYTPSSNLPPPNGADQLNDQPTAWVQLNGLWAPSRVSAPWGYQPHYVEHTDPSSGAKSRIIAVPAARYEGNEDGRGGFGALQYEAVMSQYEQFNTDPAHPMLVVLHHDGDNYGGGTEGYYHGNFASFVAWVQSKPDRFVATTIQDYLDRFPPDPGDVIHVEDGSWSGADNGDPEFKKWNGDPGADGYSPDRNSWAVITAVKNRVLAAEAARPHTAAGAVIDNTGSDTDKAWHYMLNAETSCYWYWDNSAGGMWDSHPTRAANQAAEHADRVMAGANDTVGPTIYLPQREPYNPGTGSDPSDFVVWTFVYDASGLEDVTLHYRADSDGVRGASNDLYAGGTWTALKMDGKTLSPRTDPLPKYQADEYSAQVTGLSDVLVDYYVSAGDARGNVTKSPIMHVRIGSGGPSGGPWTPKNPNRNDVITITAEKAGQLHWGVNGWTLPAAEYWPAGSVEWSDHKAVESPMSGPGQDGKYSIRIGPFDKAHVVSEVNFVFHFADGSWSSPDQTIPIAP